MCHFAVCLVSIHNPCVCVCVRASCARASKSVPGLREGCGLLKAFPRSGPGRRLYGPGQEGSKVAKGHAETEEEQVVLPSNREHPLLFARRHKESYRRRLPREVLKALITPLSAVSDFCCLVVALLNPLHLLFY